MSTANPPVVASTAATTTTGVGLGYGIAIAVSILVLISTIMLASYACIRVKANASSGGGGGRSSSSSNPTANFDAVDSGLEGVLVLGLDGTVINTYPKIILGESMRMPRPNDYGPCSICLCDYKPKDSVRCIPDCHHCFHADCVDEWLRMSATCPLCRSSPATPLAEVVPLASHAR
ncbi:hypothetical protein AB3S75_015545 [Citrus x aurantiifolia]